MARQLFSNNAASNLVGTLSQGGTTLNLVTGTGDSFPAPTGGDFFLATLFELDDETGVETRFEVVKCTGRVGDQLTIVRDYEEMTNMAGGYSYPSAPGSTVYVQLRWTAGGANQFLQKGDSLAELDDPQAVRENLGITAANTPFSPTGSLAATTVQAALAELDSEKQPVSQLLTSFANLATDANKIAYFTGPNFAGLTDLTSLGRSVIGSSNELALRTLLGLNNVDNTSDATKASAVGTLTNKTFNLANNTLTGTAAQLATAISEKTGTGSLVFAVSPTFTGTPLAPTAAADTNTTQIATTAYVVGQGYLKSSTASSTYLTQASASSTYLTQTNAASTYLSITNAASTYLTQSSAVSPYLTQSAAASTYLTTTTASGTYQPVSAKGQANGYASLGSDGKVPSAQLPSIVDSARGAISVTQNLTYNATTGVITGPNLSGYMSGNGSLGSTDLNNATSSGVYRFDSPSNGPGFTYGQLLVLRGPGDTITQIAGDYNTGTLATRGGNPTNVGGAGTWKAWRFILDALNYTDYTVTKTGSGASGTWNINIGGNAATASTASALLSGGNYTVNQLTANNSIVIGNGTAASIYMTDTDDGTRTIHNNSNQIGFLTQSGGWGAYCDDNGNWVSVGDITAYSDETLKTDWQLLAPDFVEKLAQVKSGTYTRIDSGKRQVGVGAQSMLPFLEEAVVTNADGKLSVAYGNAALAAAVELAKRILALEAEVKALRG